jgi:hypothetical protein
MPAISAPVKAPRGALYHAKYARPCLATSNSAGGGQSAAAVAGLLSLKRERIGRCGQRLQVVVVRACRMTGKITRLASALHARRRDYAQQLSSKHPNAGGVAFKVFSESICVFDSWNA